jgi:Lar family restriction alleviation protein
MTQPKLRPCPFCGGEARLMPTEKMGWVWNEIKCNKCGVSVGYVHESQLIRRWNRRAKPRRGKVRGAK